MCADYKAMPTVENPDYQDQFAFFDIDLDDFQTEESNSSSPDLFESIKDILKYISNLLDEDNIENHQYDLLIFCLKPLAKIFAKDINENIDDFLKETNIIPILFKLLHFKYKKSIGTENSILILNILAHISKLSPQNMRSILELITNNSQFILDDNSPTNDLEKCLLFDLLRSPNLSPRIITILLFSIDGASQIIENLVLNTDMISALAFITHKLKIYGHDYPEFIGPLTTLISVLFNYISIEKSFQKDEKGDLITIFHNIIINLEGQQYSFPIEEREYNTIIKIQNELLKLINLIPYEVKGKLYSHIKVDNLSPLLDILARYLDCFATQNNLLDIIGGVEDTLYSFFMNPRNADQSGKIFSQVLAIFDKILRIDPRFFKFKLINKLFEHVLEYDEDRLDILFFLSNIVKFKEGTNYILSNHLITQRMKYENDSCFLSVMDEMSYSEKENALISLLTIMYYEPVKLFEEINEENFLALIYDSIEIASSATNDYFVKMFLSTLLVLLRDYPKLLENIDTDSIADCLMTLSEDEQDLDIIQFAQSLKKCYFNEDEEYIEYK